MAFSAQKSTEKVTTSQSLVDLSVSNQPTCRRHRSVSESVYTADQVERRLESTSNKAATSGKTSTSSSGSNVRLVRLPSPPDQPKRREAKCIRQFSSDAAPDNACSLHRTHSSKRDQSDGEFFLERTPDGICQYYDNDVVQMTTVERRLFDGAERVRQGLVCNSTSRDLSNAAIETNLSCLNENNILFGLQDPRTTFEDCNEPRQDKRFTQTYESDSSCDETIEKVVSDIISRLGESNEANWVETQSLVNDHCKESESTHTLAPDSNNCVCVEGQVMHGVEHVHAVSGMAEVEYTSASPSCSDFKEENSGICDIGMAVKCESRVIMGFGIFERDVELSLTDSIDDYYIPSCLSEGLDNGSYAGCEGIPDGPVFPPDVLAALGNDGDAIIQAAMQWDGYLPPGFSNSDDSNRSMCRICHAGDSCECLLSPCRCDGSVKWTHQTCLIKWLAESGSLSCELCGCRYRIRRVGSRNCFRWKPIALDANDKLHVVLFVFASTFLLITFTLVAWISLSNHPSAVTERNGVQSQIMLPIYSCLDALALGVVCFEAKHTILRLFRRWRAKNLGIIVLNRKHEKKQTNGTATHESPSGSSSRQLQQQRPSRIALDDRGRHTSVDSYVHFQQETSVHDHQCL